MRIWHLVLGMACLLLAGAEAINWKKDYCGNSAYVPAGDKYPHLHCDKDFFTYSTSSKHYSMASGDAVNCGTVSSALDAIKALDDNVAGKAEMERIVTELKNDECSKRTLYDSQVEDSESLLQGKIDWKKLYCNKLEYVPAGGKYPHLHCGKDFFTYSASSSNHYNMVDGDLPKCGTISSALDAIDALDNNVAGKAEMKRIVTQLKNDKCSKTLSALSEDAESLLQGKINWKKIYCNNVKFVPNEASPHLHCDKDYLTYSASSSKHYNLVNGDLALCGTISSAIDAIQALSDTPAKAAMLPIVTQLQHDRCPADFQGEESALVRGKINWKKQYCENQNFVPNTPDRYPHIHCGKDFLTYSVSSGQHLNLADGDFINRGTVNTALQRIRDLNNSVPGKADMLRIVTELSGNSLFKSLSSDNEFVRGKINWKKQYCGNSEFVPNTPAKYPHLHCGSDFLTYSSSSSSHSNLAVGDQVFCGRVSQAIADIQALDNNVNGKQAMLDIVTAVYNDYCAQSLAQSLSSDDGPSCEGSDLHDSPQLLGGGSGWAKEFCNGAEFVPDVIYPHLHCKSSFITYSRSNSNHLYLAEGDRAYKSRIETAIIEVNDLISPARRDAIMPILLDLLSIAK